MTDPARRARQLRHAADAFHALGRHRGVYKAAAAELYQQQTDIIKAFKPVILLP